MALTSLLDASIELDAQYNRLMSSHPHRRHQLMEANLARRLPHVPAEEELTIRRELHALAKMCVEQSSEHAVLFLVSVINLSEAYRSGQYCKQALSHAKHALQFVKDLEGRQRDGGLDFHLDKHTVSRMYESVYKLLAELYMELQPPQQDKALHCFIKAVPSLAALRHVDSEQGLPQEAVEHLERNPDTATALGHCFGLIGRDMLLEIESMRQVRQELSNESALIGSQLEVTQEGSRASALLLTRASELSSRLRTEKVKCDALVPDALRMLRTAVHILVHTLHAATRASNPNAEHCSLLWNRINECLCCQAKVEVLDERQKPQARKMAARRLLQEIMASKFDRHCELPAELEARVLKHLGALQLDLGDINGALASYEALEGLQKSRFPHSQAKREVHVAEARKLKANVLMACGQMQAAADLYKEAMDVFAARFGIRHPFVADLGKRMEHLVALQYLQPIAKPVKRKK